MDKRITSFKLCDYRFYPYLQKVLERLPGDVKEDVLNNKALQILSDEDALESYVSQNELDNPVKTLLYLNTKILKEPDHQIIHTIAHEIANYVLRDRETVLYEKEAEDLLISWGFEEEVYAVRYDQAMTKSEGYKLGYEWAKKQDKEYLLQHFGLYYDEWNDKGLGIMSSERFEMPQSRANITSTLNDLSQYKKQYTVEDKETLSLREALIAGIMIALKEMELHEKRGWGHSSWEQAVEVAEQAEVRRLALFHHDPEHNDSFLLNMEKECQKRFPDSFIAREGTAIKL